MSLPSSPSASPWSEMHISQHYSSSPTHTMQLTAAPTQDDATQETVTAQHLCLGPQGLWRVQIKVFSEESTEKFTRHISRFGPLRDVVNANDDYSDITLQQLTFERMLDTVGMTQATLEGHRFMLKQPCRHVVPIHTSENWKRAIQELNEWTRRCLVSEPRPDGIEIGPASMYTLHHLPPRANARLGGGVSASTDEELCPEDEDDWKEACHFFCHPFGDLQGVKLPNLTDPIPPPAMVRIFRNLRSFTKPNAEQSETNSAELHSRVEVVQRMAVVALCWASRDACEAATTLRHQQTVENQHHVRCYCAAEGLTRKIIRNTMRGIHVVLAKDENDVEKWTTAMTNTFTDEQGRMAGAVYDDAEPNGHPFEPHFVGHLDGSAEEWLADLDMDNAEQEKISSGSKMSMSELTRRGVLEGSARPGQERLVMVLNLKTLNNKAFDESFCSQQTSVLVTRQLAIAGVEIPGGVWGGTTVQAVGTARSLADEESLVMISSCDSRPKKPARQRAAASTDDVEMEDDQTQSSVVLHGHVGDDELDDF